MLRREGLVVNRKRTWRLYTEQGRQVRTKKRGAAPPPPPPRLPAQTVVYGIEGGSFGVGEPLTPAVEAAAVAVADAVREEVAECTRRR
jgi:hypothetical protein